MNDNDTSLHQAILIEKLLAAPFLAAASVNSEMAKKQATFLIETCFDSNNEIFSPKMISLTVKSKDPAAESVTFDLPLITIIPFNSLCVKDISVKFDLEIVSHGNSNEKVGSNENEKMQMRGSVASSKNNNSNNKKDQRSKKSNMSVEINGGSIPLPIGLTTLLDFYSKNMQLKS